MAPSPSVSVLMTVHNGQAYLAEALEALRNQTLVDFEVVVVDDGSVDQSRTIVRHYASIDPRFRLIAIPHVGRAAALNTGLRACRGEFVAVNDADDISLPNRLEVQAAFLRAHPHVVLVGSYAEIIDESGRLIGKRYPPLRDREIRLRLALGDPIVHSTVMYRRRVLLTIGGFDERLPCAIDYDAIERCLTKGSVACISEVLVRHRRHPRQHFRSFLTPNIRWRTASKIAVRAAWHHAHAMLPISFILFMAAQLPLHGMMTARLQSIHTRILHGRGGV